jgi:hypothetical protein
MFTEQEVFAAMGKLYMTVVKQSEAIEQLQQPAAQESEEDDKE